MIQSEKQAMHLKASSTFNVAIDTRTAEAAKDLLNEAGLPLGAAVELFLKAVIREGGLPSCLDADPNDYERWFRARIESALGEGGAAYTHDDVMKAVLEIIALKRVK